MTRVAVPVIFLLVVALVGMLSRSGSKEGAAVPATERAGEISAASSYDPDYEAILRRAYHFATSDQMAEVSRRSSEVAWPLSREDAETVLRTAGWPEEWIPEALAVACGFDNDRHPSGESGCDPSQVGDGGRSLGLFQIQPRFWSDRCGAGEAELLLPLPNAACALIIVRDNIAAGRDRWEFWSVQP